MMLRGRIFLSLLSPSAPPRWFLICFFSELVCFLCDNRSVCFLVRFATKCSSVSVEIGSDLEAVVIFMKRLFFWANHQEADEGKMENFNVSFSSVSSSRPIARKVG